MASSIGDIVNYGLRSIGEPAITSFDADNNLQQMLITEANDAVTEILSRFRYQWGLKRTTLSTVAAITTGYVALTNGSATVTSVDADGNDATNFGSVTTDMYFRRTSDQVSYKITAVDAVSTPNTLTLEATYTGTTATATGWKAFQDEYALTDTDMDYVRAVVFGEAGGATVYLGGAVPDSQIKVVDLPNILYYAGGDMHRNASGTPRMMARIGVDSSDQPKWKLWPYPDQVYLLELWYAPKYSTNSTFGTAMFGGDAPDLASVAVRNKVAAAAHRFDEDTHNQAAFEAKYQANINTLLRGPSTGRENSMKVQTYRRRASGGYRVESQQAFDTSI